jgi:dTDP-4-dehydrorhamnose 3,5-epimerase
MMFQEQYLKGLYLIEPEKKVDERGFFSRLFCENEFIQHNLPTHFTQVSTSFNHKKGTLRGLHFQIHPHEESKLIRCTRGSIFDIAIDLRPGSSTYLKYFSTILQNQTLLYIPKGFAHGFQTLVDDTEVFYQMDESYHPDSARGIRWDDPTFQIPWPLPITAISEKDRSYPWL